MGLLGILRKNISNMLVLLPISPSQTFSSQSVSALVLPLLCTSSLPSNCSSSPVQFSFIRRVNNSLLPHEEGHTIPSIKSPLPPIAAVCSFWDDSNCWLLQQASAAELACGKAQQALTVKSREVAEPQWQECNLSLWAPLFCHTANTASSPQISIIS